MVTDAAQFDRLERADGEDRWSRRPETDGKARRLERTRTLRLGVKGGLVATVVMTVFRMPISDSLPPTADFWARYVSGGRPEDHPLPGLVLHLAYGASAGCLFAALFRSPRTGREVEREKNGVLIGVAYALLLSVFGERVLLRWLLGMDPEPDERFVFHVSHVVYGLTLGAWVGSRSESESESVPN